MPQALLPMIPPPGATQINDLMSVVQEDGTWTYFCELSESHNPRRTQCLNDVEFLSWSNHVSSLLY